MEIPRCLSLVFATSMHAFFAEPSFAAIAAFFTSGPSITQLQPVELCLALSFKSRQRRVYSGIDLTEGITVYLPGAPGDTRRKRAAFLLAVQSVMDCLLCQHLESELGRLGRTHAAMAGVLQEIDEGFRSKRHRSLRIAESDSRLNLEIARAELNRHKRDHKEGEA
jgi:hypothetical protein